MLFQNIFSFNFITWLKVSYSKSKQATELNYLDNKALGTQSFHKIEAIIEVKSDFKKSGLP